MNNKKTILFILMMSISSISYGAGEHSGGHGAMDHSKMNHGPMHWMAPDAEAARKNPVAASEQSIRQGSMLYQQYCSSCHGVNADGNGRAASMLNKKPANLRVMAGNHPDGDFAYKIKKGRDPMPGWEKTLNDTQVWHLVNFIQNLDKQPLVPMSGRANHKH